MLNKIIDTHVHPISRIVQPEEILKEMNRSNVDKAVLLAMDLDPHVLYLREFKKSFDTALSYSQIFDTDNLIRKMHFILENAHTPNDYVAGIVSSYPDRFIGFGSVHIGFKNKRYIKNKLEEIKQFGFKGIKILPTLQFVDPTTCKNLPIIFKFAEKEQIVILYHTGCDPGPWEYPIVSKNGNPKLLENIIKRFPNVNVILAHLGSYSGINPGIWLQEALYLAKNYSNIWGDISGVPYLINNKKCVQSIRKVFPKFKNVLFGSDFPVTTSGVITGMESTISEVINSQLLLNEEKENILFKNAISLLNL
ncbi:MAG: amidohydrolase family protein [Candidatus Hodarchaeales archaeon]